MTRRWAPQTRYTLRRNTASIMKDLIFTAEFNDVINSQVTSSRQPTHCDVRININGLGVKVVDNGCHCYPIYSFNFDNWFMFFCRVCLKPFVQNPRVTSECLTTSGYAESIKKPLSRLPLAYFSKFKTLGRIRVTNFSANKSPVIISKFYF